VIFLEKKKKRER